MVSGIVVKQHTRCVNDVDILSKVFEEIQECQVLAYSQDEMSRAWRLSLQHLAHDLASVAAVLICWPHLQRRRGFTH